MERVVRAVMVPGSALLARLHDGAWPAQVRLTSIWSRRDGTSPYPSCLIETHGLSHLVNLEVDADHRGLVTRKKVYEAVVRELRAAEEEAPVVRGPLTSMRGGRAESAGGGAVARARGSSGTDAA